MLIHPWDEATRDAWQGLLARADFGQLVTAGLVDGYPVVVPTHFLYDGDATVLLHLARPNPVWKALASDPHVVLALTADYVYVEAAWNANPGTDPDLGVPTSYYTGVQLLCTAEVVDDPAEKSAILAAQLRHFEPAGTTRVTPSPDIESDRRQLPGIRGLRLHLESVRAKAKYGGNKAPEHRAEIGERLAERDGPLDREARTHLLGD
ncbi:MAG: FMN-binding negative transcriptional regulator [Actinomycetota bacterium]|nr:FMN-binding negative transcriptional regulator [Actinomycetota bacterium]